MSPKVRIYLWAALFVLVGLLIMQVVWADSPHNGNDITNVYVQPYPYDTATATTAAATEVNTCTGSALGVAAAQHQFDFGTHSWQWAAGAAYIDGNNITCDALSFGIGKRIDRVVINGSISRESDTTAYGVGINGRF